MKYKGIELTEVTKPQIFDPPKKMLVWGRYESINELEVYAVTSRKDFPVICENASWRHCAEIPEVHESKLVTYRELARWLAKGNGEVKNSGTICPNWNYYDYYDDEENKPVKDSLLVRKWDDTEWHKPTIEYLGLEDN